jgi:hypothetical protein
MKPRGAIRAASIVYTEAISEPDYIHFNRLERRIKAMSRYARAIDRIHTYVERGQGRYDVIT